MVPCGLTLGRTTTELEPEQLRFYDSPPPPPSTLPRMDASVCCLPAGAAAATGVVVAQHPHPASLPSAVGIQPSTLQPPYVAAHQYAADQIVPDRAQPDGPLATVLGCDGAQDTWQQISSSSSSSSSTTSCSTGITGAVTATTTAYIDYSWLQMQVSENHRMVLILYV